MDLASSGGASFCEIKKLSAISQFFLQRTLQIISTMMTNFLKPIINHSVRRSNPDHARLAKMSPVSNNPLVRNDSESCPDSVCSFTSGRLDGVKVADAIRATNKRGISMSAILTRVAAAAALACAPFALAPASAATYVFNVSDIFSYDGFLSPINEVYTVDIGAFSEVIGLSWNVSLYADPPSYLSEMTLALTDSAITQGVFFTPGIADDFPGTGTYVGSADYVALGLNFFVGADGLLRLEFFESFVDFPGDWDGIWESGTITIETASVIPEPATWGMMIAGFGLVGFAARRRQTSNVVTV